MDGKMFARVIVLGGLLLVLSAHIDSVSSADDKAEKILLNEGVAYTGFSYRCGLQHREHNCLELFAKWAAMECGNADFGRGYPSEMTFAAGNNHSPGSVVMTEITCFR